VKKQGRIERPTRGMGLRVLVQVLVVALVVGAVNYLSFHFYERRDFSRTQEFRLAMQTRQILRALRGDVEIILFYSPTQMSYESLIARDLDGLMRELVFSGKPKVKVEFVDPTRQIQRALEVAAAFDFHPGESVMVVSYEGRHRIVPLGDMADFEFPPPGSEEPPRVVAFRGEQAVASALLSVLDPETRTIYFLQGQGQPGVGEDSPIRLLLDYAARQNVNLAPLNLAQTTGVPEDATAVFCLGARYDLAEAEQKQLLAYWERDGRMFFALDPDAFANTARLRGVLQTAGIEVHDTRVLRTVQLPFAIGIYRDVAASFVGRSEIVARLQGVNAALPDPVQSVAAQEPPPEGVQLRPLIRADESYWGETEHVTDADRGVRYDEGKDIGFPVYLAYSASRGGVMIEGVEIPAAKMVAVGNTRFLLDEFIAGPQGNVANLDFIMSSLNWLLDRQRLTGVVPKTPTEFRLALSNDQLGQIALYTMVVIPGLAALLGLLVWWKRRK
jgi:hypothetical protein